MIQLAVQLLKHQDKPSSKIFYLTLSLLYRYHQLHTTKQPSAVMQQVHRSFEVDIRCQDYEALYWLLGIDRFQSFP